MVIDYKRDIEPNQLFNQKKFWHQAVGHKLREVERFFATEPESFFRHYGNNLDKSSYFSLNLGATRFSFENNLIHELKFFDANSPIIRIPGSFRSPYGGERYQLSAVEDLASARLRNCLGKVCQDVRLWKFSETEREMRIDRAEGLWTPALAEEYEAEIRQEGEKLTGSGISYLLSNGEEIIYCCNFYDDDLGDRLLFIEDLNSEYIHSCYSLKENKYIVKHLERTYSYN